MKELMVATPPNVTQIHDIGVGGAIHGWKTTATAWENLHERPMLPDVIVVRMKSPAAGDDAGRFVREIAAKQEISSNPGVVVLHFEGKSRPSVGTVSSYLREFRHPERVEVRWEEGFPDIGCVLVEIEPKLAVLREIQLKEKSAAAPRESPLDRAETVLEATRDLRDAGGALSARRVAQVFGLGMSELAAWLGRSRQAVHKTPAADSLQPALGFFERVARLRVRLSDADFRKWLRMPNEMLDGRTPLQLLADGNWQILADFADDMLTGSPS